MYTHDLLEYRNSAGKFLPYLIDVTFDNCKFQELSKAAPPLFMFIMKLLPLDLDNFEACPLNVSQICF